MLRLVLRSAFVHYWLGLSMRLLFCTVALASATVLSGCSQSGPKLFAHPIVDVAPNTPDSARHAVLHLLVVEPGGKIGGYRSLESPSGSGSGSDGHFSEERIVAIRPDGFEVLFTQGYDPALHTDVSEDRRKPRSVQTATIFFHFGETTNTTAIGCEITGTFK